MHNKIIIRKSKNKRLEIKKGELKLLAFIEQQRLLTIHQSHQFLSHICRLEMAEYSFKNKIRKWEDYHLVRGYQYSEGFEGERFKYICIGSKGIDLLIEHGFLETNYNKSKIYKFDKKRNIMHYVMTQQVVINFLVDLTPDIIFDSNGKMKYFLSYDQTKALTSHSPSSLPYTEWIRKEKNIQHRNSGAYHARIAKSMTNASQSKRPSGITMTFAKPDWIIKVKGGGDTKDLYLNIELDMGTEPIETIAQKIFQYARWAERRYEQKHIVNIVIADNSFSNRSKLSDGINRANNIIKKLRKDEAIIKRIKESKLKVLICTLKLNTPYLSDKLFYNKLSDKGNIF